MSITPIPHEPGRFYVQSESRPEILHIVDLSYQEDPWDKPHPACGCEDYMAQGHVCKHLLPVALYLLHEKENQTSHAQTGQTACQLP